MALPLVKILIRLTLCMAILFLANCGHRPADKAQEPGLRQMKKFWLARLHEGYADSVIARTRPYYYQVKDRSDSAAAHAGLQLAQAYTLRENADSARFYLNEVEPLIRRLDKPVISILYYNVKGALELKYGLNYPGSLAAYNEGFRIARKAGHLRGMTTMLSSIVYIYYVIGDPHGMEYAREVRVIVDSIGRHDPIAEAHASMAMALMNTTNNNYPDALRNLDVIDSLLTANHLNQLMTLAYAVRGEINSQTDHPAEAELALRKAIEYKDYAEPSMGVMALYRFGQEKERRKDYRSADSLYHDALTLSRKYNNLEFRADVLLSLAKLHLKNHKREEALKYFESYHNHIDSLHKTRMVQDFNNLILENHNLEKQTEVQKYRIAHLNTQKVVLVFVALVGILLAVIISMLIFYRKRRKLYTAQARRLMEQNKRPTPSPPSEETASLHLQEEGESTRPEREETAVLTDLFSRIEKKMTTDRLYREKGLSLESLAEILNTNRTYVSRAVNACSGKSFSSYINHYRISEAILILSDPQSDILIKELADRVGFNSDSALIRIFKKETGMTPNEFRQSAIRVAREDKAEE